MLEKFFDSHLHIQSISQESISNVLSGCISLHSITDIEKALELKRSGGDYVFSFGVHPQHPEKEDLLLLNKCFSENLICAVGECGFDLYTQEFKDSMDKQIEVFEYQLDFALKYNLPLVLHGRKCNEKFFAFSAELKKLPSVLFHSFMGSPVEAESFIKKGINCWFSFGKQIFNGNKNVLACVERLPVERLLCETDAPFQFLKGENFTSPDEIKKIYEGMYQLKKKSLPGQTDSAEQRKAFNLIMENNFKSCFCIPLQN